MPVAGKKRKAGISAVIFTRNSVAGLPGCIHSLYELVDEVVVADWSSSDGTHRVANEFDCRVFTLASPATMAEAWHKVTAVLDYSWVLKIQPFQQIACKNCTGLQQRLRVNQNGFVQVPEYLPGRKNDYFYRTALVNEKYWDSYNPVIDEFELAGSRPDFEIEIRSSRPERYQYYIKRLLFSTEQALVTDSANILLLSRRSFYYRRLSQRRKFQNSVAEAIKILSTIETEIVIREQSAVELFGYYADSLAQQKSVSPAQVDSLLKLQQNLPFDVRLVVPLALLLHKIGQSQPAVKLLDSVFSELWAPASQTITHQENFLQPVILLLSILREQGDEERLINVVLNIYTRVQENGFDPRELFTYLNDNEPDFFNMLEGILQRKIEGIRT